MSGFDAGRATDASLGFGVLNQMLDMARPRSVAIVA